MLTPILLLGQKESRGGREGQARVGAATGRLIVNIQQQALNPIKIISSILIINYWFSIMFFVGFFVRKK